MTKVKKNCSLRPFRGTHLAEIVSDNSWLQPGGGCGRYILASHLDETRGLQKNHVPGEFWHGSPCAGFV